jgi:hypothetical protein
MSALCQNINLTQKSPIDLTLLFQYTSISNPCYLIRISFLTDVTPLILCASSVALMTFF